MIDSPRKLNPHHVLLDLLRLTRNDTVTIRALVDFGQLFGFSENAIRVATCRLVEQGRLARLHRGHYRLTSRPDPLVQYLESWRDGEQRIKQWHGHWLTASLPRRFTTKQRQQAQRALAVLGFVDVNGTLWMRPDNLNLDHSRLQQLLRYLECPEAVILLTGSTVQLPVQNEICSQWPTDQLQQYYQQLTRQLEESMHLLPTMESTRALTESYLLGGEAIHTLIRDPMLPEAICPSQNRRKLWEITLQYDAIGRNIWARQLKASSIQLAHPQLKVVR